MTMTLTRADSVLARLRNLEVELISGTVHSTLSLLA